MKIETQILEDHQAKLTVDVDAEQMEGMKRRAARRIANKIRIPGFRPGKAPYQVIVRNVGEATILEEALELLVDAIYPDMLEESQIEPYGPGRLENIVSQDPLKLEFIVPMKAEVDLGDYRSLRRSYKPAKITKKDVEEALQNLRERQAIIEPVDRPAQEGDLVTARLSARRTHVEEGKDPVFIRESTFPFVIHPAVLESKKGNEPAPEWPFPGFSQNLIGLSENEEKTIQYVFPHDAELESMREQEGEFHISIVNVKSRKLPELNDNFATSLGEYESLDELRKGVRTALENQAKQTYDANYDEAIMKMAIKKASFKYPPQMMEQELDKVLDDLNRRIEQQKLSMDLYLKSRNLDMDGLKKEMSPIAEERLKNQLFLLELVKAEGIKIEPDELKGETENTLKYLNQMLPEKEARKLSDDDVFSNLVDNIYIDMISRRAIERFREICSGKVEKEEASEKKETNVDSAASNQIEPASDSPSKAAEEIEVEEVEESEQKVNLEEKE